MGKKRVLLPANEVDLTAVKYEPELIQGFQNYASKALFNNKVELYIRFAIAKVIMSSVTFRSLIVHWR